MTYFGSPAKLFARRQIIESGEAIVRSSRALHIFGVAALALAVVDGGSVHARRAPPPSLSAAAVDQAVCSDATRPKMPRAAMFKAEVLLDRLHISPGVVDGKTSENARKAIVAFQRSRGLAASGKLDQATWDKLCESTSAPGLIAYTITDDDVRGRFGQKYPPILKAMPPRTDTA